VALSEDGSLAVSGHGDGRAWIWDAETGEALRELAPHSDRLTSATLSPDGRFVVTTSSDHNARLSDVETGKQRWLLSHAAIVSDAAFSADGRWVLIAGPGYAGVVDANTGERILLLNGKDRLLTAAAFSPTGWRIATGGESGAVRTYDCLVCGSVNELIELAKSRLAQLRATP
jgi:WD40 repeat protein